MRNAPQPAYEFCIDVNSRRSCGLPDEQIAINLNLPLSVVEAVPLPRPQPQRQRAVQHQQLMKIASTLMPKVEAGDHDAITSMLKVMKREADLLGLDAPKEQVIHNFNNENLANIDDPKALPTSELRRRVMEALERGVVIDVEHVTVSRSDSPTPEPNDADADQP